MQFFKYIYWLIMFSRWYQIWSKTYRFLFQRKYTKETDFISKTTDFSKVQSDLDKIFYNKDTFRVLWDVCFSPYYLQNILNTINRYGYQPHGSFDCDDYACLAANSLDDSLNPKMMSVAYKKKGSLSFKGHMVCVFQLSDGSYCHMGNWGLYFGYSSLDDIAKDISDLKDSVCIGYTLFDKNLSFKHKVII